MSITQNGQQNSCKQDARHTKDYRNVKCGDLPSVPTMKQSVCVCVQSNTVLQCSAAAAAAQRSGSVLRRSGVTRDRLLPHSSAARRCREREKSQLFIFHHTWRQGVYPLLHSVKATSFLCTCQNFSIKSQIPAFLGPYTVHTHTHSA